MSRAFTKEADNELPPPIPERQVSAGPNPVTARGAQKIEETIQDLEQRYQSEKTDVLARDLRYWQARRVTMEVIPLSPKYDKVRFGARVVIRRRGRASEIQIVGEDEADVKTGLISWKAPLARAIEGAAIGETVHLEINGEEEPIVIVALKSGET